MRPRTTQVFAAMVMSGLCICGQVQGAARGGPDFDGDGREDLVVNVRNEDQGAVQAVGAVHVIYGSGSGPTASGDQLWHQDKSGVNDSSAFLEFFGWSVTWGDFDGDGFDDLAAGVPFENVGGENQAGGVAVLYGSSSGLRSSGDQFWTEDSSGMNDSADALDLFGSAVAAGDFDEDGFDDLAIGVPGETVGGFDTAGAVHVIYGRSSGLSSSGDHVITQNSSGVPDSAEEGDGFGRRLASGDFDGDGKDDVAVGATVEEVDGAAAAGMVFVLYGSNGGLSGAGAQGIEQDTFAPGSTAVNEQFGDVLCTGDFDGNGRDDLAIGVWRDLENEQNGGEVDVVYGSAAGLNLSNTERWTLFGGTGIGDLPGNGALNDQLGVGLASGDFDGDGRDDLAIGVPGRAVGGNAGAGEVIVLEGGANGLREATARVLDQDSPGMNGTAEEGDNFGAGLRAGDFDGDGKDDLAIGVPHQEVSGDALAGAVHVIFGSSGGLTSNGDRIIHQDSPGIAESTGPADQFGRMTTAEFDA